MNDTMSEDRLLAEKKVAFMNAERKLSEAENILNELYMFPDLRKRLTEEQYAAIVAVQETYCKLITCSRKLQDGLSK